MRGAKTKLILERAKDVSDGMGSMTRTWERVIEISGVFWGGTGNERLYWAVLLGHEETHYFMFRRINGVVVENQDRFRLGDRLFEIKDIGHDLVHRANWDVALLKEYQP
jgi:hypothetical protein